MKVLRNKGKKGGGSFLFFFKITSTKGEKFCYDKGG